MWGPHREVRNLLLSLHTFTHCHCCTFLPEVLSSCLSCLLARGTSTDMVLLRLILYSWVFFSKTHMHCHTCTWHWERDSFFILEWLICTFGGLECISPTVDGSLVSFFLVFCWLICWCLCKSTCNTKEFGPNMAMNFEKSIFMYLFFICNYQKIENTLELQPHTHTRIHVCMCNLTVLLRQNNYSIRKCQRAHTCTFPSAYNLCS